MWRIGWRDTIWSNIDQPWDLIIIGGGITGAGIFLEATRFGLKTLLIEAGDFASGTSSRSSKMVHGGLRYLRNAQIRLTNESVHERELLLKEGRGLVQPLPFLMLNYAHDTIPWWVFGFGLAFYDLLALKWSHRRYNSAGIINLCPFINPENLVGGYRYIDALTDDARLVLRLIKDGVNQGGTAINYTRVVDLVHDVAGSICGVVVKDVSKSGFSRSATLKAKIVVNATGAWADDIRSMISQPSRIRKLRGSHLLVPHSRLPITRAITALHHSDGRPVYALPWEGITIIGTTDIDHKEPGLAEPSISDVEVDYLLEFVNSVFADYKLSKSEIVSTLSGLRAVVNTGKKNPSKESREHFIWNEKCLLTVAGGKLTTFRLMAYEALKRIKRYFPEHSFKKRAKLFSSPYRGNLNQLKLEIDPAIERRLSGRFGDTYTDVINTAKPGELSIIPGTQTLWAELRYALRNEGVIRLDDLLLRRTRIGNILPCGGMDVMDKIKEIVQYELHWGDDKWQSELDKYSILWSENYSCKD